MLRLVLPNYLDNANSNEQAAIAKLLGVEAAEANRYDRWGDALREYAAVSETSLLRACLAFSLVQGEDAVAGGWAHERAERHRAFLAAKGYEPTPYEVQEAEVAARRHEEALARTAEFRADVIQAEDAIADTDGAAADEAGGPTPDDADQVDAEQNGYPGAEEVFDDAD